MGVLCLEVSERIAEDRTVTFARNLGALAQRALVVSWAAPEKCGLGWGHVNCRSRDEVIALLETHTKLKIDVPGTDRLRRAAQISWIRDNVLLFRQHQATAACRGQHAFQQMPSYTDAAGRSSWVPDPGGRVTEDA